jgi:hypothetical protein
LLLGRDTANAELSDGPNDDTTYLWWRYHLAVEKDGIRKTIRKVEFLKGQ